MVISNTTTISRRLVFKLILLGDGAVGKTSLKNSFLGNRFSNEYIPTLGTDFTIVRFGENDKSALQIWDLSGQPGFKSVRKAYYAGTAGAILIFDLTRPETLQSLTLWMEELLANRKLSNQFSVVIVGNKSDLIVDPIELEQIHNDVKEYVSRLTDQLGIEIPFYVTSAKTGENVKDMFAWMIEKLECIT